MSASRIDGRCPPTGGVPRIMTGAAKPLPDWLIHTVTRAVADVDHVGAAVAVDVAEQQPLRVEPGAGVGGRVGEAGRPVHHAPWRAQLPYPWYGQ